MPKATRAGQGIALSPERFLEALIQAPPVVAALMRLQFYIGLRMEESIASKDSLKSWLNILKNGGSDLTVSGGTKGGKIRAVYIHKVNREAVFIAIAGALAATENAKSHFYPDAKNDRSAKTKYGQDLAALGLKKEASSHAMRRAFAVEDLLGYLQEGFNAKSALARVSQNLGHGDGRGRWVWNCYVKNSIRAEILDLLSGDTSMRLFASVESRRLAA